MKKLLLALCVMSLLALSMVSSAPLPVEIQELKINGNTYNVMPARENLYVEEGEGLEISVKLRNTGADIVEDIDVEAEIKGYEYADHESLEDTTHVFDLEGGDTRWVNLNLRLPSKLDKDLYLLRIRIADKNSDEISATYNLKINPTRHGLDIDDVVFSPGTSVKAGHSLLTTVLIDNFGGKDEHDIKVTLEIPDLGLSVSDYIDTITSDDKKTSEELFLKLPQCVEAGDYNAQVTLKYDESYETIAKSFQLHVLADERCQTKEEKLVLTVGPETQNVVANQQAAYPIALTNAGTSAQTYVLELTTGDWATSSLSENLIVLEPGKTKVVYAYVTANAQAGAGEKVATLAVKSDDSVLKTIYLKANVVAPQKAATSFNLRNGLEIALIVLVVVLVIVGLVIGFSRLKKDEETESEDKTYY